MRGTRGLIRQQHGAARTQVAVHGGERGLIERSEIIGDRKRCACELKEGIAVIFSTRLSIEAAVAGNGVDIAAGIRRRAAAALPDPAFLSVRGGIESTDKIQILSVVSEHPAMMITDIAKRAGGKINHIVAQQQRGALIFQQRSENHMALAVVGRRRAWSRGLNFNPARIFIVAVGDIQRMNAMRIGAVFFSHRHHVKHAGGRIDHGRAGNADFRINVVAFGVAAWHRGNAIGGIDEAHMPQHRSCGVVCVECIDAVMFGRYINHVVKLAADHHIRHIERLSVNGAIHDK